MKILILGSRGYIGTHLVEYHLGKGNEVTGCDLGEPEGAKYNYYKISVLSPDFDDLFAREAFDICINAAGSGNVAYSVLHPFNDFEANTLAVAKILDAIRKYRPGCRYIHLSSAAVYGNPLRLPILESDEIKPFSPYGYHKWMSELLCREYQQLYNISVTIIRPFSVYGKGLKKQLMWDICQRLEQNDRVSLFGTGAETRDFIHVTDLVALIGMIIDHCSFKCEIYNAATGVETSIREIADIFQRNFPGGKEIGFSGEVKKGDPFNWRADVSKSTALGFRPKAGLENAIIEYINWYRELAEK